jgi:hypothetical protein
LNPASSLDRTAALWRRVPLLAGLYLFLLMTLCTVAVWRPLTASDDFWAHAAVGRWMCENGDVPRKTLFLWTASEPWVAHSWLAQLIFHGLAVLPAEEDVPYFAAAFSAILVAVPYLLAWWLWARRSRITSWMLLPFGLGVIVNFPRYQARPELFSAVFLACLLSFLVTWSGSGPPETPPFSSRRAWRGAVLLFVLLVGWTNFHGAVLVGLLLLGVTAACDLVQDRLDARSRVLALLALLAPVAVCINPYGIFYWRAFASLNSYRFATTTEWWPLWRIDPLPVEEIIIQGVLLALALVAWVMNPGRRWAHLAWVLVLAALYVKAARNAWFLTLGSLIVLAVNSNGLAPERLRQLLARRRPGGAKAAPLPGVLRWVVRLGVVLWVGSQIALRLFALREWDGEFRPVHLDTGLIQFIRENRITGRMFNDYESSRYLECRLAGEPQLFISAHTASYTDQVMRDYFEIIGATRRGRDILDNQGVGVVVLTVDRTGPSLVQLADRLDASKSWRRVYAASDGIIWVRRIAEYEHLWNDPDRIVSKQSLQMYETWLKQEVGCHSAFSLY